MYKSIYSKKIISVFILILINIEYSTARLNLSGFDKQSFLIGSLDDYMGHQQTLTATKDSTYYQLVDVYAQQHNYIAVLIDSLFKPEFNDLHITNNGAPKGIRLYSKSLSANINRFYNYTPSGLYTVNHDTIYFGRLKPELFPTEKQKLSFLAGAFLKDGGKSDTNDYFFTIPNSTSKAGFCVELLKKLKCTDVKYVILKDRIPVGNWITFKPSKKVLSAFKRVEIIQREKPLSSKVLDYILKMK